MEQSENWGEGGPGGGGGGGGGAETPCIRHVGMIYLLGDTNPKLVSIFALTIILYEIHEIK